MLKNAKPFILCFKGITTIGALDLFKKRINSTHFMNFRKIKLFNRKMYPYTLSAIGISKETVFWFELGPSLISKPPLV